MDKQERLIMECLALYLNGDMKPLPKELSRGLNFRDLDETIRRNNLGGLFHLLNQSNCFQTMGIPDELSSTLKLESWKNSFANEINDNTASHVCRLLDMENIQYSYLKGALTRTYHKDSTIFSSADTDIFIKKDDYKKVKNILLADGFSIPKPDRMMKGTELSLDEYEEFMNEIMFIKKNASFTMIIDVQWDFIGLGEYELFQKLYDINDFILSNIQELNFIGSYPIKTVPMEKHFYVMAFHYAFHHGFRGLKWLIDMAIYYSKERPKIEKLCEGITKSGRKTIGIVVRLMNELMGLPKPNKSETRELCIDRLLPFEYSLYKSMFFKTGLGVWNSVTHRIVKIMLPYRHSDKLRVLHYILFNSASIKHRADPNKRAKGISQLFSLIGIFIKDSIKRKDDWQ